MRVSENWPLAHEFACNSKACAPPPAGRGGSLPGTAGGNHKAAYTAMKKREGEQQRLAQTNRARANHGMKPIVGRKFGP